MSARERFYATVARWMRVAAAWEKRGHPAVAGGIRARVAAACRLLQESAPEDPARELLGEGCWRRRI